MARGRVLRALAAGLLACALCHTATAANQRYIEDEDRFPGWKGVLPSQLQQQPTVQEPAPETTGYGELGQKHDHVAGLDQSASQELWRGEVKQLSWSPRAFLLKGFLSDQECDYLINKAKPMMTKSTVVDNETGKSVDSTVRTSTGTFFARGQDHTIAEVEKRIAMVSHLPVENGEGLQILHYVDGQKYEAHHDFFHDKYNALPSNGGQRIATVLMYLTSVDEGGETVFPHAVDKDKVQGDEWSDCAKRGLAVKAKKGDALLFFSLTPAGHTDDHSLHGSCPTTQGEKWSATKWIHVGPFGLSAAAQKAKWGDCIDADGNCKDWAASGECEKNAAYMLTSCRKACNVCSPPSKSH